MEGEGIQGPICRRVEWEDSDDMCRGRVDSWANVWDWVETPGPTCWGEVGWEILIPISRWG